MNKQRSDSTFSNITPEQRETIETWLFTDRLGYHEVAKRIRSDMGIAISHVSVAKYYHRVSMEKRISGIEVGFETVGNVAGINKNMATWESAAMFLIHSKLLQLAVEQPDNIKELGTLASLVLQHKQLEIQKSWLHHDAMRMAVKAGDDKRKMEQEKSYVEFFKPILNEMAKEFPDITRGLAEYESRKRNAKNKDNPSDGSTPAGN